MALHPGENRGYRELMLTAEEARTRLGRLAGHLELESRAVADKAAETLTELLEALKPALAEHDLDGDLAARGAGARIGMVRAAILDRFLERNQAFRFAVDDLEHVTTLLGYLANLSEARGKKNLPLLCRAWERKLRRQVGAVRKAAIELGNDPDEAIEPLDPSPIGQADQSVAGTDGEAVDRAVAAPESSEVSDQPSREKKPLPGAAVATTPLPKVAPPPGEPADAAGAPGEDADAAEAPGEPAEPEPPKPRRRLFRRG